MNNEVKIFNNENLGLKVRTILNNDGSISINVEDTAIGFGWFEIKDGKEYIRWRTINNYLNEIGFSQLVAKDDYIPESLFYMLGMKASNKTALEFQKWLAIKVLPKLRKTGTYTVNNNKIPFTEIVKSIDIVAMSLRVNDASKLLMYDKLYQSYNIPTDFLPKYESNGNREMRPATELLKRLGVNIKTVRFNQLLIQSGYLEERSRKSNKSNELRYFKAITEKGLKYGENLINEKNQKEVQPYYYADTFAELYDLVTPQVNSFAQ